MKKESSSMSDDTKEIIKAVGDEIRNLLYDEETRVLLVPLGEMSGRAQDRLEGVGITVVETDNPLSCRYVNESEPTHVRIETLGCGELTVPVDHITLHMVGGTHRLLIRDDIEWREVSPATYNYIKGMLDYV
jgi:hypothetical protein